MSNTAKSINIHELNKLLELYITCNVENIEIRGLLLVS